MFHFLYSFDNWFPFAISILSPGEFNTTLIKHPTIAHSSTIIPANSCDYILGFSYASFCEYILLPKTFSSSPQHQRSLRIGGLPNWYFQQWCLWVPNLFLQAHTQIQQEQSSAFKEFTIPATSLFNNNPFCIEVPDFTYAKLQNHLQLSFIPLTD